MQHNCNVFTVNHTTLEVLPVPIEWIKDTLHATQEVIDYHGGCNYTCYLIPEGYKLVKVVPSGNNSSLQLILEPEL